MNNIVDKLIQIIHDGYIHDPNRILQDYHKEIKEIEGYRGRELLELIQNAVDELTDDKEKCVCIELNHNEISVSNNGSVFTEAGVKSLMYSDLSPKYNNSNYIGNKGTGFRSILNWAENVSIYSGNLSIAFNKKNTQNYLNVLLQNENVQEFKGRNNGLQVSTLAVPQVIKPLTDMCFDTVVKIKLELSDDVISSVREQISQIDMKLLLFLAKLEKLIIITNDSKTVFTKTRNKSDVNSTDVELITIEKVVDGELIKSKTWNLKSASGQHNGKRYEICVAYTDDLNMKYDVIYSYFKTDIVFPLPILVHGTFDLTADRNHLIKNETNKFVLSELCSLIISAAKDISISAVDYAPFKLLALINDFPKELEWFDFQQHYINTVANSAILPTVNGKYISFVDSPKYYVNNLADYLGGKDFEKLLLYTDEKNIQNFIKKIAFKKRVELKYRYFDITIAINKILNKLTMEKRAYCAVAFLKEYKGAMEESFPDFLIDMYNRTVRRNQIVYLLPESQIEEFSQPPQFTKMGYLHADMRKAFSETLGLNQGRDIAAQLEIYNVKEYNLTTIIQGITARLTSLKNANSKNTLNFAVEAVKWLWKNRESIKKLNTSQFYVYLVDRHDKIQSSRKLYWGKEYGGSICDNLFINREDLFVCGAKKYGIDGNYVSEFKEFFSRFGVAQTPRIQLKEVNMSSVYINIIKRNFVFPLKAEGNFYKTEDEYVNKHVSFKNTAKLHIIEHLGIIMEKASTKAIIQWLIKDIDALAKATQKTESDNSYVWIAEYKQKLYRRLTSSSVFSYIRFILYSSKWIEVNGDRYAPSQCILFSKVADTLLPVVIAPNLEDYFVGETKRNKQLSEIKEVLIKIGMAQEFSELGISTFYEILLMLPRVDNNGELSKALYTSIIENQGFDESDYAVNEFFQQYMEIGEVFCKNHKKFTPIQETFYLTEKTVCEKILKNYNLIAIPHRQSMKTIEHCLGVKPLRIKGSIVGEPVLHCVNKDFSIDFNDYKLTAFCYRRSTAQTSEKSMFKSLDVRLCSKIEVNYSQQVTQLSDYEYISEKTNLVYLKVPVNYSRVSDFKMEIAFCGAVAGILTSACDIQDKALFAIFRDLYSQNQKSRREIITQDFDDIDALTEAKSILNYTQSKSEEFISTLERFAKNSLPTEILIMASNINYDDFTCINNGEIIFNIFTQLHILVNEFNKLSEIPVDLCSYYLHLLGKLKEDNLIEYKCYQYHKLKDEKIEVKKLFCKYVRSYQSYTFEPENILDFNCLGYFDRVFSEQKDTNIFDIDEQYKLNRTHFANGKDDESVVDFLASDANDSLLYFGEINILLENYQLYLKDSEKQLENERIVRSGKKHVILDIQNVTTTAKSQVTSKTSRAGATHTKIGQTKQRNNETWGQYGERLVYDTLTEKYGNNVKWVSENARKDNVNPNGTAGLGYDVTYINSNDVEIYVEVKSTKDKKISFQISENELLIAEKNAEHYEIFIVTEIETEPKLFQLPDLFKYTEFENRENNARFKLSVENNYTINCDIK
ncbi:DUF3883 domain-containing protein [Clostridium sp.]